MTLIVGQTLFYVDNDNIHRQGGRKGQTITVVKLGRKWAEMDRGSRIDMNTLQAQADPGFSSRGRCWLTEADFDAEMARRNLWSEFAKRINQVSPPDGITEHTIRAAAALLNILIPDK